MFNYFWQPAGLVVLLLTGLGIAGWARSARRDALLLWTPSALALVAAAAHLWPFGGNQHMVFAAPAVFLTAGLGLVRATAPQARGSAAARALGVGLFLGVGLLPAAYHLVVPRYRHELRPLIDRVGRDWQPGDAVITFDEATYLFYSRVDLRRVTNPPDPAGRVWVVGPPQPPETAGARAVDGLRQRRPLLASEERPGATLSLFGPEPPTR